MANGDHTAIDTKNGPTNESRTSPLVRFIYPSAAVDPRVKLSAGFAGISTAINVLNRVRANSESIRDRQACSMPLDVGECRCCRRVWERCSRRRIT
jgi:hypothetical protein